MACAWFMGMRGTKRGDPKAAPWGREMMIVVDVWLRAHETGARKPWLDLTAICLHNLGIDPQVDAEHLFGPFLLRLDRLRGDSRVGCDKANDCRNDIVGGRVEDDARFISDRELAGVSRGQELWLINAHIGVYEHGNIFNHEPTRTRKLLVHKSELNKLIGKTQQKGLTLVPTRLYFRNGRAKVEIALAKGKQHWDKRETERRKTADKEAREAMARSRKS